MNPGTHGRGTGCENVCCLQAEHLSVDFGGTHVFHDVNFHVHCGEIAALIGPNGAGKSSLFKALLGQIPYDGKIEFRRAGNTRTKLLIGYVPQSPVFDPGDPVSVYDLLASCMSRRPIFIPATRALRAKITACLERVHAADLIDRRIGTLSGGELQRVLLAMALEPTPHILLLDEPTSGVDVDGMALLMGLLDEIRRTYDLSILMSTHDFTLLNQYADKVFLLHGGIIASGTPAEVFASPAFRQAFHFSALGEGPNV
ncbi:MAG: metal ABC transporter ATP-binding protein [Oscillospiraceae bacterium]|jgi:zinc transport system ATP-binding protein